MKHSIMSQILAMLRIYRLQPVQRVKYLKVCHGYYTKLFPVMKL